MWGLAYSAHLTDPFRAPDTTLDGVVTEGDLCAVHGLVLEQEDPDQGNDDQQMQLPVALEVHPEAVQTGVVHSEFFLALTLCFLAHLL